MCVLFATTDDSYGKIKIDYSIEILEFDLRKRKLRENQSFFLTNESDDFQNINIIHRKNTEDIKPLDSKNSYDNKLLWLLCNAYDGRFAYYQKDKKVHFHPKRFRDEQKLEAPYLNNLELKVKLNENLKKEMVPFTSIKIAGFPPRKTVFFSLNMTVKNSSFDHLVGRHLTPYVSGGNDLLKKIKFEDLLYIEDTNKESYVNFLNTIDKKIINPLNRDIFIQNKGSLPICNRLTAGIKKEYIENKSVASQVSLFHASEPIQDFSIEVRLPELMIDKYLNKTRNKVASLIESIPLLANNSKCKQGSKNQPKSGIENQPAV